MGWTILLVVVVLLVLYFITAYNGLVNLRNMVKDQWAQVDVLLKRRADLIPNLVETVKGYAAHEKDTLEAVINARNKAVSATTSEEEMKANGELTGALNRLFALAESYPELKANTNFIDLQNNLKEADNTILVNTGEIKILQMNKIKEMFKSSEGNSKKKIENLVVFVIILIITMIVINMILKDDKK